jgi:hypothetical protein
LFLFSQFYFCSLFGSWVGPCFYYLKFERKLQCRFFLLWVIYLKYLSVGSKMRIKNGLRIILFAWF